MVNMCWDALASTTLSFVFIPFYLARAETAGVQRVLQLPEKHQAGTFRLTSVIFPAAAFFQLFIMGL